MKIFAIMQRDWAKYGLPLVNSIKRISKLYYRYFSLQNCTYNLIKKRKDLFNKIWLGYKYDDKI